ncbi:MAG: PD-(D/E)XK nuclease family protein [Aquabacterium sp.]
MNAPRDFQTTYTVRASSWGKLFDCAFAWQGEHLLGIRKAAGLRAHLGTSIHASTAAYDSSRLSGAAPISIDDAAGVFVDALHKPDRDVDYQQDDITVREAERIGLKLHTSYCMDIAPQFEYISVEAKLPPLDIDCGNSITVRLTGSMDRARVAQSAGGIVIPDVKTGVAVIEDGLAKTKGRSPQLGTYQIMFEQGEKLPTVGAQIIALQTNTRAMTAVSPIFDAKRVMVGTEDAPGLIQFAASMFRTGLFPPNPTSMLCSPKYCARWSTCPYHE